MGVRVEIQYATGTGTRMDARMQPPTIVYVLYVEADPDGPPAPTNVLGVFQDDHVATALEHARARAGILCGAHTWELFEAEPHIGLRRRWESVLENGDTAVIEPHALEPVPAPPRTGRRPKP